MESIGYRFIFPDTVQLAEDEGRQVVAKILDGNASAYGIFHYDTNGKPLSGGMPMVRMRSSRNYFEMTAIGLDKMNLLGGLIPAIYDGLFKHVGVLPAIKMFNDTISVTPTERPYLYIAHSVILDRGLEECERFEKMTNEQRIAKAHAVLCRGLERQADAMMSDLPDLPSIHQVSLMKYHPRAKIVEKNGIVVQHGISISIEFYWNAKINGSWAVGGLTSKGHGRIWYGIKAPDTAVEALHA